MTTQPHSESHLPDERRAASRFGRMPDDDFAAIWTGQEDPLLAEVHDESLHGISLILDADCGIAAGCQVHVVYAGMCHLARACHVRSWSADKVLVGFQCEPLPASDPAARP